MGWYEEEKKATVVVCILAVYLATGAQAENGRLCYMKDAPGALSDCTDYLGDLSTELVRDGPKPLSAPTDSTVPDFLAKFCTKPAKDYYECPVHFTATDVVKVVVGGSKWSIRGNCYAWEVEQGAFVHGTKVYGRTQSCKHRGTEYLFIQLGLARLLHMNIMDVLDEAYLTCGGEEQLHATSAYLLSRGVPFYKSMYGKAYASPKVQDYEAAAKKLQNEQAGLLVAEMCPADDEEPSFCKTHGIHAQMTWKQVAEKLLEVCRKEQFPRNVGLAFTKAAFAAGLPRVHKFNKIVRA